MFTKEYFVSSSEVDQFLELKISSVLKYIQDVSSTHADELGVGKNETLDKGMSWVIARMNIEIIRMPKLNETIYVSTYPLETMYFLFPRNYIIKSNSGETLIKASSIWAVIDHKNRKPSFKPFDNNKLPFEHYENELPTPNRLNVSKGPLVETRKIRYSEIDLNGHLSNIHYMDFILDTHDKKFFDSHKIKFIELSYIKEIIGDEFIKIYSLLDDKENIIFESNDEKCFECLISYR